MTSIDIYGNDADLTHDAVADDSGHKVATMGEPPESTDATLSGLTLSGIVIAPTDDRYYPDIFRPSLVDYTAGAAYSLTQTTVTPTVNDSGASYVIKLGGVTDADGTMSLAAGSNVITVEVTAEDGQATKTYTVTVTRASAVSTDATLRKLNLSGIDIGIGMGVEYISGSHTSYAASVYNSVSQTTLTATPTHSAASYAVKLGGVTDADGVISLSMGSNVIMVEVMAEDGQTTKTYTVTVTRATQSTPTTGELPTDTPRVNFRTTVYTHNFVSLAFGFPRNRGITGYVIQRYEHDGDSFVSAGADGRYEYTYGDDSGGGTLYWSHSAEPDTLYKWVVKLLNSQNASVIETSLTVRTPPEPDSTHLSDATLSDLTLSSIDFEATDRAFISAGFHRTVTSYVGRVANSVTETTVTPTVNHSGASYVIKLGSVTDADGTVSLAVGSNVITVEVTAEDGETTRTYTVTVTRVSSDASTDATLRRLVLRGVDFGTFASATTSYTAQVASSVAQTTVSAYPSHTGASTVVKLGGVAAAYGRVSLAVGANVITVVVTAEDLTTTKTYTVTVTRAAPTSTDATLQALTLRGLFPGLSNFSPNTTYYRVSVVHSSTQATVMPTLTDPNASYVIKIGGVVDEDGVIPINAGRNTITIEVTAADGETTKTYTVLVVRDQAPSTDATLSDLTLSSIDFGTFDSDTTSYSAQVPYRVSQTTVTPTENHYRAHSVIKLNGVEDQNGIVSLAVGSNVITVEVKAEDRKTSLTYTVTVTRAAASTDATLTALTLSGIDFGTFASGTTSYSAQVANSVTQTTVTPTVNHSLASYVIKVGGVTDADGVIVFGVGRNVITVEVTAEDTTTTRTYTVTVTRAAPPSTDATLSALTLSGIDFGTFDSTTASYTTAVANSVAQTTVTPTVNDFGASYVIKLAGVTDSDGVIPLAVGSNVITVEVTAEDGNTSMTYTVTVNRAAPPSTDATLSALTLSGVGFGTFAPGTTSYTAQVDNSVSQTTVTPTVNDSGASYVIKLGGATDADGVIALSVGNNVITVEVTAEDDNTTRTYTVTVTRAEPPTPQLSNDAALSALTLSGIDFGIFDSTTVSYTAQVANSVTQTTVSPTVNDSGASYVIKLGGVTDADGVISLSVDSNVITVEVTAEDGNTTRTYAVTVTRSAPLSADATLSSLTLSGVNFGTFAPGTTSYTAQVANSISRTTVTPTLNDSGASYVIKLGGATDADGMVALSVGRNVVTVEVTAEDGNTSQTYTLTVTRESPLSTDAKLSALAMSGVDFGTFDSTTVSYTAIVAHGLSQTTVNPTLNHSGATYVVRLNGTVDTDGVVPLSVGSNTITIEVTAQDGIGSLVYTVEVTRAELPTSDTSQRMLDRYDANDNGVIDKEEAISAVLDYFDGLITKEEALAAVLLYFFSGI